jgi:hypothetical protein
MPMLPSALELDKKIETVESTCPCGDTIVNKVHVIKFGISLLLVLVEDWAPAEEICQLQVRAHSLLSDILNLYLSYGMPVESLLELGIYPDEGGPDGWPSRATKEGRKFAAERKKEIMASNLRKILA